MSIKINFNDKKFQVNYKQNFNFPKRKDIIILKTTNANNIEGQQIKLDFIFKNSPTQIVTTCTSKKKTGFEQA